MRPPLSIIAVLAIVEKTCAFQTIGVRRRVEAPQATVETTSTDNTPLAKVNLT